MIHKLPELNYDHSDLDPHIDEATMLIHHGKHHQGYVNKLNSALEGHDDLQELEVEELLSSIKKVPEDIRTDVINNGGGHANHSLFWEIMTPNYKEPEGEIMDAINSEFGGFETFKQEFTDAATSRFGSGWAWLVVDGRDIEVMSTANQDSPLMEGKTPILGLDVWEHAYYLKYQNERGKYVVNWWNVVNWEKVNENLQNA